MSAFEPVALEKEPDIVLVYGDVNSTVAAALVCSKLLICVARVEAGLRSFDCTMPEEINRIVTDRIADMLFTPSGDADQNLLREGVEPQDTSGWKRNDRLSGEPALRRDADSEERLTTKVRAGDASLAQ